MSTATQTREQEITRRTVDRLTEAVALLGAASIAQFARSAADTADTALMIASNEAKLAQRA